MNHRLRRTLTLLTLTLALPLPAQTLQQHTEAPAPSDTPAGRWLSERITSTGIGTWYDIRPDGTLTAFLGPAVTAPVTHTANTLSVPDPTSSTGRTQLQYSTTGNILNLHRAGEPDTLFTRDGAAPRPSDPLLGRWRPNPPAIYSTDPTLAARQHATTLGVYEFRADNTQTVRIPYLARTGRWDAAAHTLTLAGEPHPFTYQRTSSSLVLTQQGSDAPTTESYLPDPLFPQ